MTGWWVPALLGGALIGGYGWALFLRPSTLPKWSLWRTLAWTAGVLAVVIALSPPLVEPAHHDHRYHMAQHLFLGMYAPLGLVLGAPLTLLLGALPRRGQLGLTRLLRSGPVHAVSHPISAAVLNIGGMFVLYLTPLYTISMERQEIHWLVLAHFLLAGYLYTWSIAGPDPAPRRPGMATRVTVLILAAGAHAFLAKFLYANSAQFADGHGHSHSHDEAASMEAAAQWMYYGGDIAEVALAVMLFSWWYRRRKSSQKPASALATASTR
ncbi:cytochrome c oxidase assembly protein [Nesterenkonia natronophila]|uniref:Cytochrome c oxidase assembly protein n=1 Tax=Nesterenkonia natronophila TaxID=2174932 RepID=A0A3A4F4R5_9MICC|nr:cytochrome c oxidase assembly protein [Nesterenkonia natronophila]RJN32868.1 cytochrome c oxidase assembly protein [Nesterenkonia natronophila]